MGRLQVAYKSIEVPAQSHEKYYRFLNSLEKAQLHLRKTLTYNSELVSHIPPQEHKMAAEPHAFVSFTKTYHHKPYPHISPTRPELSAAGKNVVITGGGTGIGKAIAIAFAQANAASVSIIGRRLNRLEEAARDISAAAGSAFVRVVTAQGDLSKRESAENAFSEIVRQVGKIDVFVSNAGIFSAPGPVASYDEDEFRRGWEVNFIGAFNAVQAFLPHAAPKAKLINVSSGIAHIGPKFPGVWTYAAVKAGLAKMFDFLASENPDLHVVQIQPGVHATEMNEGFQDTSDDARKFN